MQRKVLKGYKVILVEHHPHTMRVMNNLALTLQEKGKLDEAEALQRKVMQSYKVILGKIIQRP
ncbi:hypothetical protein BZA77DRAFT_311740 [Pyronema omphalodes]|nr:hypothetical protein BZA77DRAFT_311740 [Pyronema omphalodes]